MAQSIKNLEVGSKIKDNKGNIFTVVAHNHYASNQVTLMHDNLNLSMQMHKNTGTYMMDYGTSEVHYYLNNDYLKRLQAEVASNIVNTTVRYNDALSLTQSSASSIYAKVFLPALGEVIPITSVDPPNVNFMYYFSCFELPHDESWTRSETINSAGYVESSFYYAFGGNRESSKYIQTQATVLRNIVPFMNLPSSVLVSDKVSNGYYSFVFNEPPIIQTINNIKGNYGSTTNISYVAIDNDDTNLRHYISFDNGTKWQEINPTRSGNAYTYSHVFNELSTYYCRIKVVDSANNETVSNAFTITVNAVAPTVNIVSVVDKVVTFKVNCITSEISKVEILINNQVIKTFTSGFDFNLVYEIDRSRLNIGKNSIQIKATSQENLIGYANLEASKTKYNLPPIGTKVIIGGIEYTISNASENGSNQTYTLNNNLINQVKKGDAVQITQDSVKVLCAMSTLENVKDYKEMKLVKTKKLKGDLEGYVEEKYELQGEGRYSTVKLEMQRFSNNVSTEILELQQYFDYLED